MIKLQNLLLKEFAGKVHDLQTLEFRLMDMVKNRKIDHVDAAQILSAAHTEAEKKGEKIAVQRALDTARKSGSMHEMIGPKGARGKPIVHKSIVRLLRSRGELAAGAKGVVVGFEPSEDRKAGNIVFVRFSRRATPMRVPAEELVREDMSIEKKLKRYKGRTRRRNRK